MRRKNNTRFVHFPSGPCPNRLRELGPTTPVTGTLAQPIALGNAPVKKFLSMCGKTRH